MTPLDGSWLVPILVGLYFALGPDQGQWEPLGWLSLGFTLGWAATRQLAAVARGAVQDATAAPEPITPTGQDEPGDPEDEIEPFSTV